MTHDLTDPKIVRALSHPLRAQILLALDDGEASPVELSTRLDAPLGTVSYHVNILADLGLIKLARTTPRRGAVEHHYRAVPRQTPERESWDRLPAAARAELARTSSTALGEMLAEVAEAGGFDRQGAAVTRSSVELDEEGWAALAEELRQTIERVNAIAHESARRLARGGDAVVTGVLLALFEMPPAEDNGRAG